MSIMYVRVNEGGVCDDLALLICVKERTEMSRYVFSLYYSACGENGSKERQSIKLKE